MINGIVGLLLGSLLGLLFGYLFSLRWLARQSQLDEVERMNRLKMRRFRGKVPPPFSEVIKGISPSFCKIYDQAHDAGVYKLDQVSGLAYGKALEFLIKDYAKAEHPENTEEIERCALGRCIKDHISDEFIKNSSELAVWLRNDQAHYIRKYADRDVNHLKRLIHLTLGLVENAIQRRLIDAEVQTTRETMTRR